MKLYKLTDQDGYTRKGMIGETKWFPGRKLCLEKVSNPTLCSRTVVHAYTNLNLALLMNPVHARIKKPVLWEAEGEVVVQDKTKVGCCTLTTIKEMPLPKWYIEARNSVALTFAILCAESVLHIYEKVYSNDDRPRKAIECAKRVLALLNSNNADAADDDAAARAAAAAARAAAAAADADDAADAAAARVATRAAAARVATRAAAAAARAAAAAADAADAADAAAARVATRAADAATRAAAAAARAADADDDAADAADAAAARVATRAADAATRAADADDDADAAADAAAAATWEHINLDDLANKAVQIYTNI